MAKNATPVTEVPGMTPEVQFLLLVGALILVFVLVYLTRPIAPDSRRDAERRNRR